ncbi:hypothetical protein K504DRAFT_174525 [Pleomassaria siparia CBS 279.74]|uniref:Uncharacterized protein n=1 Tax=Pleomassaria siparia CBS 279.74 TaxID=1314801 RepID=A0A6G1JSV9_9PLEO|nr:hypothetical protein K504DRAFT_174525 [Pleomassaria siparia CBS 279.74]
MPGPTSPFEELAQSCSDDISQIVGELKKQRDHFETLARQYESGYKTLKAHFQELHDRYLASQAKLANEQTVTRRLRDKLRSIQEHGAELDRSIEALLNSSTDRCANETEIVGFDVDGPTFPPSCVNFRRVEQSANRKDFVAATTELDRLLKGPLSADARIEGLLLRSIIVRASMTDPEYEALVACIEALEICKNRPDVKHLIPKVQYYAGICHYRLRRWLLAQDAFNAAVKPGEPFSASALYFLNSSIEKELDEANGEPVVQARSAFEEHRAIAALVDIQLPQSKRQKSLLSSHRLSTQKFPKVYFKVKWKRKPLPSSWLDTVQRKNQRDGDNHPKQTSPTSEGLDTSSESREAALDI